MPRLPDTISGLVDFCVLHEGVWNQDPEGAGLTQDQVNALKTALVGAREALESQSQLQTAARAATVLANDRVDELRATASALLRSVTTFAQAQSDPSHAAEVYAKAQIDPARRRTPPSAPGQPVNITATLGVSGEVTLKWKCKNPPGGHVMYVINRRVKRVGSSTFSRSEHLGVSGTRSFTDDSIPAGAAAVTYTIQAHRGQTSGPMSAVFWAQFGNEVGANSALNAGSNAEPALREAA